MFRYCMVFLLLGGLLAGCNSMAGGSGEVSGATVGSTPVGLSAAGKPAAAASGQGYPGVAATASAAAFTPPRGVVEYKLGPLDIVSLTVFQVPELSGQFQVGTDGMLSLPLIGAVPASGKTAQQVQKEVASRLQANYMQAPQVVLQVTGFNSQKVTVDGAVAKPGVFPVSGSQTLLDYIALAGGLPRTADPNNVVIFREVDGKRMGGRFSVAMIRQGKATDPVVYGGDLIIVPTSGVRSAWSDFLSALPVASFAVTAAGL